MLRSLKCSRIAPHVRRVPRHPAEGIDGYSYMSTILCPAQTDLWRNIAEGLRISECNKCLLSTLSFAGFYLHQTWSYTPSSGLS